MENSSDYILKVPFKKVGAIILLIGSLAGIFLFGSKMIGESLNLLQRFFLLLFTLIFISLFVETIRKLSKKTAILITKEGIWNNTLKKSMFIKWEDVIKVRSCYYKKRKMLSVIYLYLDKNIKVGYSKTNSIEIELKTLKVDFHLLKDTIFSEFKEYNKWYIEEKQGNIDIIYRK
ncbi:MAG: hypothetical protein Q4C98_01625 [Capnocytophaga sp.]|nr:hypothetical protein [Capnocytophaga sp.]